MSNLNLIGTTLSSPVARACGICGTIRKLSRAHVPPQAAGNTKRVQRAPDLIENGQRRPGRWNEGGMWVRGLCEDCNNRAGSAFDEAYGDFARDVGRLSTPIAQALAVVQSEPPAVRFAPGLVSRAALYGMFAINPRLRILFPELASDLVHEVRPGVGPVRWPDRLSLKVGLTHPGLPNVGVLSSGVWSMRVLHERVVHEGFGDIVFPPLFWSLVPDQTESDRTSLGPQITQHLCNASEWVKFGPDRTAVDLRTLTRDFPPLAHPMLTRTNDWIELMASDGSDTDVVVVYGRRA